MNKKRCIFLYYYLFSLLLLPVNLAGEEITIDENFKSLAIGSYLEIYEDFSKTLRIEDLLNQASIDFQSQDNAQLILSPRRNTNFWAKTTIKNKTSQSFSLVFWTNDTYIRFMDFYIVEQGHLVTHYKGGLQKSFQNRAILHKNSAYPIQLKPNETLSLYLKVDRKWDTGVLSVNLALDRHFYAQSFFEYSILGIYNGFLIMVILIALTLYLATWKRLFLWYFLYAISFFFFTISSIGFDYQFLVLDNPTIAHHSKLFFSATSIIFFYFLMVTYFRENKENIHFGQWHSRLILALFSFSVVFIISQNWVIENHYGSSQIFKFIHSIPISAISLIILFLLLKVTIRHPKWNNLLFLVAYLGKVSFGILFIFINNGKILLSFDSSHIFPILSLFEMACLSVLMVHRIFTLNNEKLQLDQEVQIARIEKEKAAKINELNQVKNRLYTNITHEFRTPLTVIKGLTEQISGNENKKSLIQRNSDILLRLINQILALSKADKGELTFSPIQNDLIPYIQYLSESFKSWGAAKNIRLHFLSEIPECVMDYDPDKLQEVLSNLLSNAVKNTAGGGDVYIILKKIENQFFIKIKDTGIGIESEFLPHIFDRFYQIDQTDTQSDIGTGIGLALCKELVTLMNGQISVKSQPGIGSEFDVKLPITHEAALKQADKLRPIKIDLGLVENPVLKNQSTEIEPAQLTSIQKQATILIVEDNADVRHYLSLCLEKGYQLLIAENGQIGIQKAKEQIPDLILSDIMMPHTNGLELCEILKTNIVTSHIPIILLTAKADRQAKLQGLSRGADAYLTKPFNKEELIIRIQSLIEQRQRIQEHFLKNTNVVKAQKYATENEFLNNIKTAVLSHLLDESFDVQRLAFEIGMSRSQVYRKVKALTGRSIASYIRYLRLQEGKKLLENTNKTVSEIAYEVGFNDLSYFSNSFSQEFGYPPNATRK